MLPGYKQRFLNGQALKRLDLGVDIPSPKMSIGDHNRKEGIPVRYTAPIQKLPTMRPVESIEETGMDGQGNPVNLAMFPNSGYFGDALGGVGY